MTLDQLRRLSLLLDEALDLSGSERRAWLEARAEAGPELGKRSLGEHAPIAVTLTQHFGSGALPRVVETPMLRRIEREAGAQFDRAAAP